MTEAYPLHWPAGISRTPREDIYWSRFAPGTRLQEIRNVRAEIERLGGDNVIVSTDMRIRADGNPYARDKAPADRGVAVYFDYQGSQKCFACDRWLKVEENLRAIFKSIEAIRGLERWGSSDFVESAFRGFTALPAPMVVETCWQVLGLEPYATAAAISKAYRAKQMDLHQRGASGADVSRLNVARDQALEVIQ